MAGQVTKSWAIGIDVGNSNTRVAIYRCDRWEIIPDAEGAPSMPSYVSFNHTGRLIGSPAKRQRTVNPRNTIFNIMRFIGKSFEESSFEVNLVPFPVAGRRGRAVVEVEYMGEVVRFSFVEILAMILAKAKSNAEAYLGCPVSWATLTVPPHFTHEQIAAVNDAAKIAKLMVLGIELSPTAMTMQPICELDESIQHWCVIYDLGGGSCNAAIVVLEAGVAEIRSAAGDESLGGMDFIMRMVDHFAKEIRQRLQTDIKASVRPLQRLYIACEKAMNELSSAHSAQIHLDSLINDHDFHSIIHRDKFEEICQDLFRRALIPVERALEAGRQRPENMMMIIAVGGCARIPKIQQQLVTYFRGKDLIKTYSVDESQVSGLAFLASLRSGDTSSYKTNLHLLFGILPFTIGVDNANNGQLTRLILRNTTIPTKKSEVITVPKGTKIVNFYTGDRHTVTGNRFFGYVDIGPLNIPGEDAELEFTVDIDSRLVIEITVTTFPSQGLSLKAKLSLSYFEEHDIETFTAREKGYQAADEVEILRITERNNLDSRISSLSDSFRSTFGGSKLDNLIEMVNEIRDWVDDNTLAAKEEYEYKSQELDELEARSQARELLVTETKGVEQQLVSSPRAFNLGDLLREVRGIASQLDSSPLAGPDEYSRTRDRVNAILVESRKIPHQIPPPSVETVADQPTTSIPMENDSGVDTSNLAPNTTDSFATNRTPTPSSISSQNWHSSDLVRDSRLEAYIQDNEVIHVSYDSNVRQRQRRIRTETKWRRKRVLGAGAFGRVWLEECFEGAEVGNVRAVKMIPREVGGTARLDYSRELEAIAKFSHSKYVHCFVKSYGWYESEDTIFISMEYFEKGDLQQYLSRPFPEPEAREVTLQLLEGVSFMHENGFAHRDLKPGNILVLEHYPDWWVKIGDFGISKRAEEGHTSLHTMVGTRGYLAPEVIGMYTPHAPDDGDVVDPSYTVSVDLWALGAIAFQMLTNRIAFSDQRVLFNYVIGNQDYPSGPLKEAGVSDHCVSLLGGLQAASPARRPSAIEALEHPWITIDPALLLGNLNSSAGHLHPRQGQPISDPNLEATATWSTVVPQPY